MHIRKSLLGLTAGAVMLGGAAPIAAAGEFDGVTVNILTRPGYVIAGRLVERGVEFQEATGAKIVVTEVLTQKSSRRSRVTGRRAPTRSTLAFLQPAGVSSLTPRACWRTSIPTSPRMTRSTLTTLHLTSASSARRSAARPSC